MRLRHLLFFFGSYRNVANRIRTIVIKTKNTTNWKGGIGSLFGIPNTSFIRFFTMFINGYNSLTCAIPENGRKKFRINHFPSAVKFRR